MNERDTIYNQGVSANFTNTRHRDILLPVVGYKVSLLAYKVLLLLMEANGIGAGFGDLSTA